MRDQKKLIFKYNAGFFPNVKHSDLLNHFWRSWSISHFSDEL